MELTVSLPDGRNYVRIFEKPSRLILLGGGTVAQAVCRFAPQLGFSVVVLDDRPDFANRQKFPDAKEILCDSFASGLEKLDPGASDYVAVLTRGHRYDADCLRRILSGKIPFYLGMMGSKRRVQLLLQVLEKEGFPRDKLKEIHAPIGVPIQALTPDEIAISILAELIQCRRQKVTKRGEEVLEQKNMDPVFLEQLKKEERQVIALVIECKGSTPVKPGAIMAVNEIGKVFGTIGGGCGEYQVMQRAHQVFRDKQEVLMWVDLTGDTQEDDGMVCGGMMQVYLKLWDHGDHFI